MAEETCMNMLEAMHRKSVRIETSVESGEAQSYKHRQDKDDIEPMSTPIFKQVKLYSPTVRSPLK